MRRFVEMPPAQNPFVTSLDERAAAIKELAPDARAALVAQAERIVREQRVSRVEQGDRLPGIACAAVGRSRRLVAPRRRRRGVRALPEGLHDDGSHAPIRSTRSACGRWPSSSATWTGSCASSADRMARCKERVEQLKKDLSLSDDRRRPEADHGRHRRDDPRGRAPVGAAVRRAAERPRHRATVSAIPRGERRGVVYARRLSTARGRQFFRCRFGPIR